MLRRHRHIPFFLYYFLDLIAVKNKKCIIIILCCRHRRHRFFCSHRFILLHHRHAFLFVRHVYFTTFVVFNNDWLFAIRAAYIPIVRLLRPRYCCCADFADSTRMPEMSRTDACFFWRTSAGTSSEVCKVVELNRSGIATPSSVVYMLKV